MSNKLTPREIECVRLAGGRLSNGEIATRLGSTTKRVAKHLQSAYAKLGVHDRRSAVRALGNLYPGLTLPLVDFADSVTDQVVPDGLASDVDDRDIKRAGQPETEANPFLAWYFSLGTRRTPPRGLATRLWIALRWAVLAVVLCLLGVAVVRSVDEVGRGMASISHRVTAR